MGSIRATVLDSATAPVIGYDDYDPWGYPLVGRTKPIPNAYLQGASKNKFTGKERDDEFGLNLDYFGGRYYDWLIGRWPTVDQLWFKHPDVSPYVYVLNNPIRLIDPDGKQVDFYDMLLIDQGLREKGYSEQVIQDLHEGQARGALLGAAIGIGVVAAVEITPLLVGAILSNPVTTNEIGIGITEALAPGAENVTAGAASKLASTADEVASARTAMGKVASTGDDWAKLGGMLQEATKGKGNFGIGSATAEQADAMGKAWVGKNYKVASDGKTLISADGTRQYRPPTYKPNLKKTQANFEQKVPGQKSKQWQSNAHVDIIEEGNQ